MSATTSCSCAVPGADSVRPVPIAIEHAPATVAQVARARSLARQSVQRVADVLEADGLVRYEENPAHRRAKLVTLTPSGRAALAEIQAAQRRWADTVGAKIGTADLETANEILSRVLEHVSQR
jgi:DNA-binding MarR family transcriptional regulator